jgi:hypothetical protein
MQKSAAGLDIKSLSDLQQFPWIARINGWLESHTGISAEQIQSWLVSGTREVLKDAAQGVADVTVTSAAALDEARQKKLTAALEQRLQRQIRLHCEVDPNLIGGAIVRAGDLVIDGSLSTRLERIAYELTA